MIKELQDFGLSDKEARVYLAALEIGRATADQLAKHSKIVRSTTYVQLESLMKMGLMSTYEEGKKTYFAPESPELLKRLLLKQKEEMNSKEQELTNILPFLLQQFEGAGERPVVRFFLGKQGIVVLRDEVLMTSKKEIEVISSAGDLEAIFTLAERQEYSKHRAQKGIKTKLLYTRAEGKFEDPPLQLTERAFISPQLLPLATDIVIFDDCVGIMTLKGSLVGVIMKSKEINESFRSIFDFLWAQAEKH